MFVVGRKVNMLSKVEGREKREELRGEVVRRIIEMNVEVTSNDEFMRGGSSERERKDWKSSRKTELGLESGDDEGVCSLVLR